MNTSLASGWEQCRSRRRNERLRPAPAFPLGKKNKQRAYLCVFI